MPGATRPPLRAPPCMEPVGWSTRWAILGAMMVAAPTAFADIPDAQWFAGPPPESSAPPPELGDRPPVLGATLAPARTPHLFKRRRRHPRVGRFHRFGAPLVQQPWS